MEHSIKQALEGDFSWISAIQTEAGLPKWKPTLHSWRIGQIAFAIWQCAGDEAELLSVAVQREERGKGYGKAILEYSIKRLTEQGARKFFLEVREGNRVAISLYEKLNFEKISVRKGYYEGRENAVLMRLSIS